MSFPRLKGRFSSTKKGSALGRAGGRRRGLLTRIQPPHGQKKGGETTKGGQL